MIDLALWIGLVLLGTVGLFNLGVWLSQKFHHRAVGDLESAIADAIRHGHPDVARRAYRTYIHAGRGH